MLRLFIGVSLLAALSACSSGSDDDSSEAPGVAVSGQITYDRVPAVAGQGLVYAQTVVQPARGVTVELLQAGSVRASTTTDATGNYSFSGVPGDTDVSIRVRAEMLRIGSPSWNFRVVDNVNGEALYTLAGAVFNTGDANVTRNLHAASGWGGAAYTETRSAAPFAILDVAYDAVQLVLTAEPLAQFPALRFQWSPANVPVDGTGPGEIGSSRFQSDIGILLVGAADQDTDEYDRHVIAHEFGHYLEYYFSRSDSIGGPHALSDQLDMRLAFGEAWGTAFAAMATGDAVYKDTFGAGQRQSFSVNVEQSPSRTNPNPGWFNEESLQSLLFDLYDNGRDVPPGSLIVDDLALGFGPIWQAFATEQRTTSALTSVFPFVASLRLARPGDQPLIDQLTTTQRIATVTDAYGTGQTNFGLPTKRTLFEVSQDFNTIYNTVAVGGTLQNVCSLDDYTSALTGAENKLASRRYVRFTVTNPGPHTITVRARAPLNAPADPDLVLHRGSGQKLVSETPPAASCSVATPSGCVETFSPTLSVGEHVLELYEWTNTNRVDESKPEDRPIGRTCFDVTVTR